MAHLGKRDSSIRSKENSGDVGRGVRAGAADKEFLGQARKTGAFPDGSPTYEWRHAICCEGPKPGVWQIKRRILADERMGEGAGCLD